MTHDEELDHRGFRLLNVGVLLIASPLLTAFLVSPIAALLPVIIRIVVTAIGFYLSLLRQRRARFTDVEGTLCPPNCRSKHIVKGDALLILALDPHSCP